ncbi:MAG: ANTAR domain-containing protein [Proteobacteria bacterium]|nr:ANTAR domain-containing protein [Pseudomonadota bacterium]
MTCQLKILIVDDNPLRATIIEDGLREAGHDNVARLPDTENLLTRISAIDPDVIVIDLGSPSRDILEQMFHISRTVKRPVAMFVDQSDSASIRAAMDAGVSAYVVDGLKKERIKHILDMCISRFNVFSRLLEELSEAKTALAERKVLDRAKGILMKANGIAEEEAYALMRKTAMNEKRRITDVARALITASDMLEGGRR